MNASIKTFASRLLLVFGLAGFAASGHAQMVSDPGDPVESKTTSALATRFIKLVDQGKTAETWALTGPILRSMTTQADFEKTLKSMRSAAVPLKKRELYAARFTKVIDGAPNGHYFIIFFVSNFGGTEFEEKVIYSKAAGKWKVEGYFMTPMSQVIKE